MKFELNRREFLGRSIGATTALLSLDQLGALGATAPAKSRAVPGPVTTVRPHRGKPQFFLDGRPYTKPIFGTYVPKLKYFRQFAEAGSDVFSFSTNLGNGFSAPTWLGLYSPATQERVAVEAGAGEVIEDRARLLEFQIGP